MESWQGVPVEVCIECVHADRARLSFENAVRGGASRIELCSNLEAGGLTPAVDIVETAAQIADDACRVLAMVRPRAGDFTAAPDEVAEMIDAMSALAAVGARGVVFGVVSNGAIDRRATARLARAASDVGMSTTFHRAFDTLEDPLSSIELLIEFGIQRVLTSGTPWGSGMTAVDGLGRLGKLAERAGDSIEVVVGGCVTRRNARQILATLGPGRKVSLHAHADLVVDGVIDSGRVTELVRIAAQPVEA